MKSRAGYITFILALTACGVQQKKKHQQSFIKDGIGIPVQALWIDGSSPNIHTEDFFIDGTPDSIVMETGTVLIPQADGIAAIRFENGRILHHFTIYKNKQKADIIAKSKVLIPYEIRFTGESGKQVAVKGDFNNWESSNSILTEKKHSTGSEYTITLQLSPGSYSYQLVIDGVGQTDPANPIKKDNGFGGENSVITAVERRVKPQIQATFQDKVIHVICANRASIPTIDLIALWNNQMISAAAQGDSAWHIQIPSAASQLKRSWVRIYAASSELHGNDLLLPLEYGKPISDAGLLGREDLEKTVMYFAFIDRFKDGNTSNNKPLTDSLVTWRTNFQGGDIQGMTEKLRDGYLEGLGFNALWISPISKNPEGAWGNFPDPKVKFSGYHGYWPTSNVLIDPRFGSPEALDEMLDVAHSKNTNVYLDYVAHHVHKEHPIYKTHPDWVTPLYLLDGRMNTELWDEQRLTTWFDTFMPTLDLSRPRIAQFMVDSAMFWLQQYDFDGFRHDATKHIPENFTRLLTQQIRKEIMLPNQKRIYQIGETYGNPDLIGSYLGVGLLDAQFDFNLYDALLNTFGRHGSLNSLHSEQMKSIDKYGSHHLMGNITGNQDKPRFMSIADGSLTADMSWNEMKKIGHLRDLPLRTDSAYSKFLQLYAWIFTAPGIPVVYYGDEIGMTGGNDPGNRNMMQFDNLTAAQLQFRNSISQLSLIRSSSMALCYGDYQTVLINDSQAIIKRQYLQETAVMVINRTQGAMKLDTYVKTSTLGTLNAQWSSQTAAAGEILPQSAAVYIYSNEKKK
jgi:glycosidase